MLGKEQAKKAPVYLDSFLLVKAFEDPKNKGLGLY